jgi:hypothetical protein
MAPLEFSWVPFLEVVNGQSRDGGRWKVEGEVEVRASRIRRRVLVLVLG